MHRCQPDEIRARECHRIWKLRLFDGQATPQIRGLIWEQACNSDSAVTADGALERTGAFMAHVAVDENSLGNSAEQICWPLLWYENGVFAYCNVSLTLLLKKSFSVPCFTPPRFNLFGLQRCVAVIQANSLPGLFSVYFKENRDYWIGLLGGLASASACILWKDPCLGHCQSHTRL